MKKELFLQLVKEHPGTVVRIATTFLVLVIVSALAGKEVGRSMVRFRATMEANDKYQQAIGLAEAGKLEVATQRAREALAGFQASGSVPGETNSLAFIAVTELNQEHYQEALQAITQAVAAAKNGGNERLANLYTPSLEQFQQIAKRHQGGKTDAPTN